MNKKKKSGVRSRSNDGGRSSDGGVDNGAFLNPQCCLCFHFTLSPFFFSPLFISLSYFSSIENLILLTNYCYIISSSADRIIVDIDFHLFEASFSQGSPLEEINLL
ncbi:hypothetical protein L6452_23397 [Arctium lappa]|uniref:Uncharacterized protein n=1 Tax=Arctium lappa TaxID=4217 RepID=A0ACB9B368_ARCLA|nr:hypothetical protein L6452_23397 [Arctium lappa]